MWTLVTSQGLGTARARNIKIQFSVDKLVVLLSLHININSLKVLSLFDNANECMGVHLAYLGVHLAYLGVTGVG